ncbi:hypoxanthine-guanine phosphoribosyltransferase [Lactobacillus hamsteri DSM 5661 = JCM 6256]|uniref:Hypoxanthine phosphoribosyltransferase n=2 Tax=Lactobacillus hamsteri TaxID=96565 RepID=A0A0R1YGY6_9LACO|nr:hypoxanthine-guanine phosphoribosyltransferase [Lactobacillus hamsteri DSM 5661 = JCM 6256]
MMNNDIESVLYSQKQVEQRMDEMAKDINKKYAGELPLVVSVMNGAMIFTSDMLRRLDFKLNLDIIKASSYEGAHSTGQVKVVQDLRTDVKGRRVILMEDIIDTGRTLKYLKELLLKRGAKSVEICAMLDKPETRKVDLKGDYIGFDVPDEFLVGYGLDYDGLYRNLPYIGVLKKRIYA